MLFVKSTRTFVTSPKRHGPLGEEKVRSKIRGGANALIFSGPLLDQCKTKVAPLPATKFSLI